MKILIILLSFTFLIAQDSTFTNLCWEKCAHLDSFAVESSDWIGCEQEIESLLHDKTLLLKPYVDNDSILAVSAWFDSLVLNTIRRQEVKVDFLKTGYIEFIIELGNALDNMHNKWEESEKKLFKLFKEK